MKTNRRPAGSNIVAWRPTPAVLSRLGGRMAEPALLVNGRRYRIRQQLPSRPERETYLAEHDGATVLIKTHQGMEHEASRRVPADLTAPYIDGDNRYLVRRYLEGYNLNVVIPELDAPSRRRIVERVTHALGACHERGVVHGDVRAWNVWVSPALDDIRLIQFAWSIVDGAGYEAAHHGPRPVDDREIDWDALDNLARFMGARTRQPRHEIAWRAPDDCVDLAGMLYDKRTAIIRALTSYARMSGPQGDPLKVTYLRQPGAEDLLQIGDRVGWSANLRAVRRDPPQPVEPSEAPPQLHDPEITLCEDLRGLPDDGFTDLAIVALAPAQTDEWFEAAVERAHTMACDRGLFVLPALADRLAAARALSRAAEKVAGSLLVEMGSFAPGSGPPDFVVVHFDCPIGSARSLGILAA